MASRKSLLISKEAFEALLHRLDPDRERAALRYEEIRCALIRYLRFHGSPAPEEQADEAINIVAERIRAGKSFDTDKATAHFFFVARNLLREYRKKRDRWASSLDELPSGRQPVYDTEEERMKQAEMEESHRAGECLRRCLNDLPTDERRLIQRYYREEKSAKIKDRKQIASESGRSINSLRVKAYRIRKKLKRCFDRHMKKNRVK